MFGALTLGSALWGEVAGIAEPCRSRTLLRPRECCWRFPAFVALEVAARRAVRSHGPRVSWPPPVVSGDVDVNARDGRVLVTVEYRLANESSREAFLANFTWLRRERLRDGAFAWGIFEDTAERGRFLETFEVDSWAEHLRQHERVTRADDVVQQKIRALLSADPVVTHLYPSNLANNEGLVLTPEPVCGRRHRCYVRCCWCRNCRWSNRRRRRHTPVDTGGSGRL